VCAPRLGRIITFYQIATKIESVYVLSLPPEVSALLELFHVAFAVNVDSFGLPLGCLSLSTFYNKLIFMMLAPMVRVRVGVGVRVRVRANPNPNPDPNRSCASPSCSAASSAPA
jgi:hypothetical protein